MIAEVKASERVFAVLEVFHIDPRVAVARNEERLTAFEVLIYADKLGVEQRFARRL